MPSAPDLTLDALRSTTGAGRPRRDRTGEPEVIHDAGAAAPDILGTDLEPGGRHGPDRAVHHEDR